MEKITKNFAYYTWSPLSTRTQNDKKTTHTRMPHCYMVFFLSITRSHKRNISKTWGKLYLGYISFIRAIEKTPGSECTYVCFWFSMVLFLCGTQIDPILTPSFSHITFFGGSKKSRSFHFFWPQKAIWNPLKGGVPPPIDLPKGGYPPY